ncbi:MAG: NAD(P)-dependent glycerol-3-phosphate dehydrogenase [Proteobacteria bacterium]|jgi:glycerol-3-phosphate dehydrogenase (NAD(P)+)|nr:NAD(P)-dependent glycerol-3-phosphate dehydrogenase [Pseudomonadota bacterium]
MVLNIAVLGAGSWGTALAMLLSDNAHNVTLWTHHAEQAATMRQDRSNERYLPGIPLPDGLLVTADLADALGTADIILIVVPSHAFRETLRAIKPHLQPSHKVAWGTKGLEPDTRKLLHQLAREELGDQVPIAVISGPTFAKEVARKLPGAVTVASSNQAFALLMAQALTNDHFRAYTGSDIIGVELGGAVKNVLAIAAGAADGLGFGANARAALIARGVAEILRLGTAMGAKHDTFMGLTGLGDLVLTCTDDQSRNRRLGLSLGQGRSVDETVKTIGQVVEGINTSREVHALAEEYNVEMPIAEQVYRVIHDNRTPREAMHALMERAIRPELDEKQDG